MLIVEDGTGTNESSNSYLDVITADTLAETILVDPNDWLSLDESQKERYLILGTMFIDTYLNPTSYLLVDTQPLLWPREKFTDAQGREVEGIPSELEKATLTIATEFINEDPFTQSISITEERFGDSMQKFAAPIKENGFKANLALQRLKNLGYGFSYSNTVKLVRA